MRLPDPSDPKFRRMVDIWQARPAAMLMILLFYPALVVLAVFAALHAGDGPLPLVPLALAAVCWAGIRSTSTLAVAMHFDPLRDRRINEWIRANDADLMKYVGQFVAVHPTRGVVAASGDATVVERELFRLGLVGEVGVFRREPRDNNSHRPPDDWSAYVRFMERPESRDLLAPYAGRWVGIDPAGNGGKGRILGSGATNFAAQVTRPPGGVPEYLYFVPSWMGADPAAARRLQEWIEAHGPELETKRGMLLALDPARGIVAESTYLAGLHAATGEWTTYVDPYLNEAGKPSLPPAAQPDVARMERDIIAWVESHRSDLARYPGRIVAVSTTRGVVADGTTTMEVDAIIRDMPEEISTMYVPTWIAAMVKETK